ncbi:hypothetical protein F511_37262 [Dorcoceras hygrometricum]|uniref:NAC domain-containing protein n=1 Tax=Dorcoceras hygrometricum TaxID=472368 RepID=A0A2Z7BY61_9LAMI|nr:hypothetical protein F511_37262 [Dorcoceras hygrometricum]
MESDHQNPTVANPNRGGASNTEGTLAIGEVLRADVYRPNKQLVTYHRRITDGGLHQSLGDEEWYFFSSRERKYANGSRPDRAAGNGYWKANAADKKIHQNAELVGTRKCLDFYEGRPPNGRKTKWIMHEFVSAKQPPRQRTGPNDMRLDDCVLCRIHRSEYSTKRPEEQSSSAASECGKSCKKNQAAPKCARTEFQDTDKHLNPSRHAPLELENLQKDRNTGASGDADQINSNSGCDEHILAAALASREIALVQMGGELPNCSAQKLFEENLDTDMGAENLEDEELGEIPKGPL